MFNSYRGGDTYNKLNINACSGGIYKTYKESWFTNFDLDSPLSDILLRKDYVYYNSARDKYNNKGYSDDYSSYNDSKSYKEVIVLQMVISGANKVIAEIMYKEDFEEYFKIGMEKGEKDDE